ncbi:hypothetical protein IWW48_000624 [Coemansia sp. RSA 1200]|nr:hypothetical protein IWW48_000624 [Coemansia sp. RSA 1200]
MQDQKDVLRRFYSDEVSDETRETVTYFFDYCYGICPIFHPASFVYRIVEGKVEKLLLDAMRAFVARIIMRKTGKNFDHDEIIKRIYQSLLLQLNDPSLDYVCAVVIAATMNGGEGDFIMFNSLSCMAVSLVTRLGWSTLDIDIKELPRTWEEWCTLEIKRRVFWLTYTNDCYQSFLGNRPITIGSLSPFVSAPKAEYTWEDITVPQSSGWPCQTNISESNSDIVRNASVAHAFQDGCAIVSIMAKMGIFFWHFKVSLSSASTMNDNALNIRYRQNWSMKPIEIPQPLSNMLECAEFKALHERLARWRDGLVRAEDLKRHWSPSFLFSEFGSHKHRLHIMRVRYFCLYGHFVTAFIILHLSNRPSFFSTPACNAAAFKGPPLSTVASAEDKALRELLAYAFPGAIHEGFLATDTLKESWDLCVDTVYGYVDFLNKNADIPLERYDHVIPISLFVCITVLIRSVRMCKQKINDLADGVDQERQELVRARKEIIKNIRALRSMWSLLTNLGAVWQVRGMTDLLRIMQVEEMSNTAELLSDLEL